METDYYFEKVREGVVIRGGGACLTFRPRRWALIWGGRLFEHGRLLQYNPFSRKCRLEHRAEKSTGAYIMAGYANITQFLSRKMRLCIRCSLKNCVISDFA